MSEEQLKAFLEAVRADAGLQEKLNAAADADAVVGMAKEAGFVITAEELQLAQAGTEISEEDLEGVAGGAPAVKPLQRSVVLRTPAWKHVRNELRNTTHNTSSKILPHRKPLPPQGLFIS